MLIAPAGVAIVLALYVLLACSVRAGTQGTRGSCPLLTGREVERVKQVIKSRAVRWNVGVVGGGDRIREVVAAAVGQRRQSPVALDELDDRNVIRIRVANVSTHRIRRNDQQGNARAITKEIHRLDVAGVVIAAAFVKG